MIEIAKYDIIKLFAGMFKTFGVKAYLVGGAVRDLLLNIDPLDFDFVGEIDEEMHFHLSREISERLNCSYDYNKHYHTAKFNFNDYEIDFVMARREYYDGIAAKPRVYSACLIEDLKRRDYTINSMAIPLYNDEKYKIVDPYMGRDDLDRKVVKVLHRKSFKDDPTRVFRGIKYAGRFGFYFDVDTSNLIVDCINNGYIGCLKPERIKHEIIGILDETSSLRCLNFVKNYEIFDNLINNTVNINLNINQRSFNELDDIRKFVVLLYENDMEILKQIKNKLNFNNNIVEYISNIKNLEKMLQGSDFELYKYLFRRQNSVDEKIVASIFNKDFRLNTYFKYKDKIKIDKEYLDKIDKLQKEKYILDKKLDMLRMYISRGENNDGS